MMIKFKRASEMTDAEKSAAIVGSDPAYFREQRWALEAARLHRDMDQVPDAEKAAAKEALSKHYDIRTDPEAHRLPFVQAALSGIKPRQHG